MSKKDFLDSIKFEKPKEVPEKKKKPRKKKYEPRYVNFGKDSEKRVCDIPANSYIGSEAHREQSIKAREKAKEACAKLKIEKAQTEAEAWQALMPVAKRVQQLDRMGMKFLRGNLMKWSKDQALVFKTMFEVYSNKLIPPAKRKGEEGGKKVDINIGLPEDIEEKDEGEPNGSQN
jgi:hypothetical protein